MDHLPKTENNETIYTPFNPEFLIVPYQVFTDTELQPADAMVYGIVYWLERLKDGICFASNKAIGDYIHIHPNSVARSLGRLEKRGYVELIYEDPLRRNRKEIKTKVAFHTTGFNQTVKRVIPNGYTRFNQTVNRISNNDKEYLYKGKKPNKEDKEYDLDKRTNSMNSLKDDLIKRGVIKKS